METINHYACNIKITQLFFNEHGLAEGTDFGEVAKQLSYLSDKL
ncbi:hypothetical protein SAMN05428977_100258 [Nitrosomonas sp. Nm166]|nr:hypothetical protein SAMN05428977_100258 [Nitrosomonas sp. Nm166]